MTVITAQPPVGPVVTRADPATPSAFALPAAQTVSALPDSGPHLQTADRRPFGINPADLPQPKTLDPFPDMRFADPLPDLPKLEASPAASPYSAALSLFRHGRGR